MTAKPPPAVRDDRRLLLAWQLLDEIDAMSTAAFGNGRLRVQTKDDGSPVTDLDLSVERMLTSRIRAAFPGDVVLGEEFGQQTRGDNLWIVDPVDGTSNLLEGVPLYAHMVAFVSAGTPEFAVVSAPVLARRWWARAGLGAYRGHQPMAVSRTGDIAGARICYGGLRDYSEKEVAGLIALSRCCLRSRGFGNFLSHMLVAEGTYDLASSGGGGTPWDIVPIALIVREAGGRLTSFDGDERCGPAPILTSNTLLHPAAVAAIRTAGPELPLGPRAR